MIPHIMDFLRLASSITKTTRNFRFLTNKVLPCTLYLLERPWELFIWMSTQGVSEKAVWIKAAVDKFEGPLLRYALRITRDLNKAEDVVQDTFLRLCSEEQSKLDGYLSQWLFTVCRNRALDVQRKDGRMQPLSDFQMDTEATEAPSPSVQAERQELSQKALQLLQNLPDNQQEVLRLKFQNDLSYKEISEITKLSVTNVGFLIHTAIKNIRQKLPSDMQTFSEI